MKASILIFSQTGNTLKVGASISKGLKTFGAEVDQISFLHRNRWKPDNADLIGIGCPVFENRPAEVVPEYLADSGFDFTGKKAFVFITSGRAIAASIMNGKSPASHYKVESEQGGVFYDTVGPVSNYVKKKTTPSPISDPEKCDLCGNCTYECPTRSITIENRTIKFHNTCIVCYRCWYVCPKNAITIKFSPGNGLIERLIYSEKMERLFGDVKPDEYVGTNLYKDVLARKLKLRYDRKNPTAEYDYTKRK